MTRCTECPLQCSNHAQQRQQHTSWPPPGPCEGTRCVGSSSRSCGGRPLLPPRARTWPGCCGSWKYGSSARGRGSRTCQPVVIRPARCCSDVQWPCCEGDTVMTCGHLAVQRGGKPHLEGRAPPPAGRRSTAAGRRSSSAAAWHAGSCVAGWGSRSAPPAWREDRGSACQRTVA